jgi:hypothetical protein
VTNEKVRIGAGKDESSAGAERMSRLARMGDIYMIL